MLDEGTLRRLYLEEQRSIRDIAAQLEVPTRTVYDALIRYRIPRRSAAFRGARPAAAETSPDEATLRRLYLEEQRSIRAIAELLDVSTRAVYEALIRCGIPRRTVGGTSGFTLAHTEEPIDETTLRRLYEEQQLSILAIANALACSPSRIRSALVRWGISRRRRGRPRGAAAGE